MKLVEIKVTSKNALKVFNEKDIINETDINQMNLFNDMKKLFNKLYLLLPENIANKTIDKLNDGKLLHVFLNEINIVEEISKEKQINNQRTRLKI